MSEDLNRAVEEMKDFVFQAAHTVIETLTDQMFALHNDRPEIEYPDIDNRWRKYERPEGVG